jgi:hypothetical protein
MKIYQAILKLLVGGMRAHIHTQTGYLISLLSFLESRLTLIFNEWLMNWDNKQDHKILLLIDNCAAHIVNSSLKPIKVVFLPTNTSLIQPTM